MTLQRIVVAQIVMCIACSMACSSEIHEQDLRHGRDLSGDYDSRLDIAHDNGDASEADIATDSDLNQDLLSVCMMQQPSDPSCEKESGTQFVTRADLERFRGETCISTALKIVDNATLPARDDRRWLGPLGDVIHIRGTITIGEVGDAHEVYPFDGPKFLPGMTSLAGLGNLQTTDGLVIANTRDLESLDGLCNLRTAGSFGLLVLNNPALNRAVLPSFRSASRVETKGLGYEPAQDLACMVEELGPENVPESQLVISCMR